MLCALRNFTHSTTSTQHIIIKVRGGNYQGEMCCPEITIIKMSIVLVLSFDKLIESFAFSGKTLEFIYIYELISSTI